MSRTDNRADNALPVTAEVGGEGGSYADPTSQVATLRGDVARCAGVGGDGSASAYAVHREDITSAAASESPGSGMVRYATEPPLSPSASASRRGTGRLRSGLIGAAAGAALAFGLTHLRRSRR